MLSPSDRLKNAKKYSRFGRAAIAHLPRYQRLAVPKYSCTPECLANEQMRLVKDAD
jgi:hypothetical protein